MPLSREIVFQARTATKEHVVTVVKESGPNSVYHHFVVWIGLETGDPWEQHEAFIVGQALTWEATRKAALRALVVDMAATIAEIQL